MITRPGKAAARGARKSPSELVDFCRSTTHGRVCNRRFRVVVGLDSTATHAIG